MDDILERRSRRTKVALNGILGSGTNDAWYSVKYLSNISVDNFPGYGQCILIELSKREKKRNEYL